MSDLEISPAEVICRDVDGEVLWVALPPSESEWRNFLKRGRYGFSNGRVEGRFLYGSVVSPEIAVATFTPTTGLDRNIWFDARSGRLMDITESR